nr:unnamed protein product [Digitaria exilis]
MTQAAGGWWRREDSGEQHCGRQLDSGGPASMLPTLDGDG